MKGLSLWSGIIALIIGLFLFIHPFHDYSHDWLDYRHYYFLVWIHKSLYVFK